MSLFVGESPQLGLLTTIGSPTSCIPQYEYVEALVQGTAAATATNYGRVYIARRPMKIISASEVHRTVGSDGGAVTLDLEKVTGTQAEGAGVNMTATNFNLKGTADTVQTVLPSATVANTLLATGDRIILKDTGVMTAVADVCVMLTLEYQLNP